MERMFTAVTEVSMGQPRHVVAEAVTRVAASIVAGCAPAGSESAALKICVAIFAEKAAEQPSKTRH